MKKIIQSLVMISAVMGIVALFTASQVLAIDPATEIQQGVTAAGGDSGSNDLGDGIRTVTNVLLFILGVVAVIVIIIGGIRFTVSGGDSSAVSGAKNMILYAVVGLVIALLAYAIVNFVVARF